MQEPIIEETRGMDEADIYEAFEEIRTLHDSFTEDNPITYSIFLAEHRSKMTNSQVQYLLDKARECGEKLAMRNRKLIEKVDNEISRLSITEKIGEAYCIDLNQADVSGTDSGEENNQSE